MVAQTHDHWPASFFVFTTLESRKVRKRLFATHAVLQQKNIARSSCNRGDRESAGRIIMARPAVFSAVDAILFPLNASRDYGSAVDSHRADKREMNQFFRQSM